MALIHGGDVEGFRLEYGRDPIDFSSNCNPLGVAPGVADAVRGAAESADRYPDPLCRRLRGALSDTLNVHSGTILCGNGAADLIFRLALAEKPKKALVTAPTFAEYELALDTVGCCVARYPLPASNGFALTDQLLAAVTPETDMVFVCNPNNPTGKTVDPALMRQLLDKCAKTGTLLVVDECFNAFLNEPDKHTLRPLLPDYDNLLILDAFTKLYGMAGIRLGYCLSSSRALLNRMTDAGQPWAVSSLAQAAGIAALGARDYVAAARSLIKTERQYLTAALSRLGIDAQGEANYLFFTTDINDLPLKLRSHGILIRDCSNYPGLDVGWYRIAVRTHSENAALIAALGDLN